MNRPSFARRPLAVMLPALGLAAAMGAQAQDAATTAAGALNAPRQEVRADRNLNITEREDRLFRRLDRDGDGLVSRQEFINAPQDVKMRKNARLPVAMKASDVIGKDVRNPRGQDLGEIQDLLVDVRSGRIEGAVLSLDGALGVDKQLHRFPLSSFAAADDHLVLNVDEQSLRRSQGFDRDNWPYADSEVARQNPSLWRASRLMGRDIEDRKGDHLGEIEDLVVDTRNGRIHSAVMRYDRPWSLDNPLIAVPLTAMQFGNMRQDISMNVDRERLDTEQANLGADRDVIVQRWIFLFPESTMSASGTTGSGTQASGAAAGSSASTGSASAGSAQGSSPGMADTRASPMAPSTATTVEFNRLDTNRDGQLSRDELQGHAIVGPGFDTLDRNDNQAVSREEFADQVTTATPAR